MLENILSNLSPAYPWRDLIQYFPSVGSTNDLLRQLARRGAPHGTAVLTGHQDNGHGRMGRSFHSPEGMGLYMSMLLRPCCRPTDLMHLTCAAAVAMCDALEHSAGFRPGIKWTNDLVWNKKKLGGILTELGFASDGTVDHIIIGIGINCLQSEEDFPQEIRPMAGSVSMAAGKTIFPTAVAASMLEALHRMDHRLLAEKAGILDQYRRDCITIGQAISILRCDDVQYGKALSVDDDGALVVSCSDGSVCTVNSGEVSIRGMYGYV